MAASILVIEDQEFTQRVIRAALRDRDFDIHSATNGEDGVEMVRSLRPDLVLLDLSLPGKDGWEVLEEIRSDPAVATTPIVIVSAQGKSAVEARSKEHDVSAMINKPFRVPELRQAVDMVLGAADLV